MDNMFGSLTPEEQQQIIRSGVVPMQNQMYDRQLADGARLMQMSQKPRSRGWLGALEQVGNSAQYIDGKLTQKRAYDGMEGGTDATLQGNSAYGNALRRMGDGPALQQPNPPPAQSAPMGPPSPMGSAPSAAGLQQAGGMAGGLLSQARRPQQSPFGLPTLQVPGFY